MDKKEREKLIIGHNKVCHDKIEVLNKKISKLEEEVFGFEKEIIPPCDYCNYDGVFRCESCKESSFKGFNDDNWW
ncbi:MAG: hypothetical protein GY928_24305 [Colwellia sp.]|nr:hypothetical protein [Colwellia sp.]